jgi:uncharacterized protein
MVSAANVVKIIRLNGGRLVGKTRLQKTAYFLEELDEGFGFEFGYHHYGPYSESLSDVTLDAKALNLLTIEHHTSQQGVDYAVFLDNNLPIDDEEFEQDEEDVGDDDFRREILHVLSAYNPIELELAATADFLSKNGYGDDLWTETQRRKSSKLTAERMQRAKNLLADVELLNTGRDSA